MDESPKQLIEYKTFADKKGKRHRDSEHVRHGVAELFVATEPLRGWRELCVEDDHSAATWVRFVARLLDTTYRTAKKVRWVMDNLGTHKVSFFYDHFPPDMARAYLQRMEIVYTPVHGSWLNRAEIEFSVLSRQALNRPFADIFGKGHVQVPMLLIFNAPVPAYVPRQRGGTRPCQRREKVARGLLHIPRHPAGGLLTDQHFQARPVRARIH